MPLLGVRTEYFLLINIIINRKICIQSFRPFKCYIWHKGGSVKNHLKVSLLLFFTAEGVTENALCNNQMAPYS